MKKVVFISTPYLDELQRWVNDFISCHNVLDIQFQTCQSDRHVSFKTVMVIYEE